MVSNLTVSLSIHMGYISIPWIVPSCVLDSWVRHEVFTPLPPRTAAACISFLCSRYLVDALSTICRCRQGARPRPSPDSLYFGQVELSI